MHRVALVVEADSCVGQPLVVVIVERVDVLVIEIIQRFHRLASALDHPVVGSEHSVVVTADITGVADPGAPIIADIIVDVIVVVNSNGDLDVAIR